MSSCFVCRGSLYMTTLFFYFDIALTFHYLFIRQEAARLWKNKKNDAFLFCHYSHLSLSLYKISGTREIENKLSFRSFALSLHKISGTREIENKLSFRSFALSLYKISGTREIESKLSFRSFALSLPHNKPIP